MGSFKNNSLQQRDYTYKINAGNFSAIKLMIVIVNTLNKRNDQQKNAK